jgi:hypothetical protein
MQHLKELLLVSLISGCALAATAGTPTNEPAAATPTPAPEQPAAGRLSGYVFGDYYHFSESHHAKFDGQHGFWFRRAYLGYDRDLGAAWTTRFRMEYNSPSLQESADRLRPYVKDAYLRWTHAGQSVVIGMSPSPAFDTIESFWGFRHIEKTPLDLYRWADSRDTGVAVRGNFGPGKRVGYHAMLGTGTGTRSELDKDKKLALAVSLRPATGMLLEVYGDWENRANQADVSTYQAFGGFERGRFKAGLQYAHQARQQADKDDLELDLFSVWCAIKTGPKLSLLARVDRQVDPNPGGAAIPYIPIDPSSRATFVLGAVDVVLSPSVRFSPNVEVIHYDVGDRTEAISRLTWYWVF